MTRDQSENLGLDTGSVEMNLFEAGVLSGAPVGATIGVVVGEAYGWTTVGAFIAGACAGSIAGWLYAALTMIITSIFLVLWRAARRWPQTTPDEATLVLHTRLARPGIIMGILAGGLFALTGEFIAGLAVSGAVAIVTGILVATVTRAPVSRPEG